MPALQGLGSLSAGYLPPTPASANAITCNSAIIWAAFGFTPELAKTLARVKVNIQATGTLTATDVSCDIYSSTAGHPNASLVSTTTTTAAITGTSFVEFGGGGAGLNLALTAGTPYWIVIKNLAAAPTTNYPLVRFNNNQAAPMMAGRGWRSSTWNGTTWTANPSAATGFRLEFADATLAGLPAIAAVATEKIFGTQQYGGKFTVPAGATWNVRGAEFYTAIGGAPTGPIQFNLWTGSTPTLVATTNFASDAPVTLGMACANFPSPVALAPGTIVRVTIQNTSGTDNASNYVSAYEYLLDGSSSQPLAPIGGTFGKSTYNGTAWTDTATTLPTGILLFDTNGELTASGGGSLPARPLTANGWTFVG